MPATCWGKMFHAWAKVIGKVSSPTVESYMWRKTVVMMWLSDEELVTERRSWWQRWGAGDREEELVTEMRSWRQRRGAGDKPHSWQWCSSTDHYVNDSFMLQFPTSFKTANRHPHTQDSGRQWLQSREVHVGHRERSPVLGWRTALQV